MKFNMYYTPGGEKMITKDMSITDVVDRYPKSADVFMRYGMHCFG
jgi:hypothetical protein